VASSRAGRAADPERSAAVRASLAVGLAVSAYGLSFGALAVASGLDIWQTQVLSLFMFSGGSQFAVIGVLASGGVAAGPAAITGAALLGVRNSLYSMRMAPVVGGPPTARGWAQRLLAGHWTIDESTAVSTAQPTLRGQRIGFWMTAAVIYVGWNLTTLLGSLLGNLIGDVRMFGLDAAAAAAFLGLLWPRLTARQPIAVAAGAAVVAAVLIPWLPSGLPVLIAALVAVVVGLTNWLGTKPA
jgi:predicted branched-subunit amino acid permease